MSTYCTSGGLSFISRELCSRCVQVSTYWDAVRTEVAGESQPEDQILCSGTRPNWESCKFHLSPAPRWELETGTVLIQYVLHPGQEGVFLYVFPLCSLLVVLSSLTVDRSQRRSDTRHSSHFLSGHSTCWPAASSDLTHVYSMISLAFFPCASQSFFLISFSTSYPFIPSLPHDLPPSHASTFDLWPSSLNSAACVCLV